MTNVPESAAILLDFIAAVETGDAELVTTAALEDPGAFTMGTSDSWVAAVVAIV